MTVDGEQILVTGGTGFIGSYVTRQLLQRGARVHALDNGFTGSKDIVPNEVNIYDVDIRNKDAVRDVFENVTPDILIHLAAIHFIPYCNNNPEEAFNVNVLGTRNVLDAAREIENLERIVNTSSAAVYEPASGPHNENKGIGPTDIYGRTKLVAEDEARLFNSDTDIPTASARLFNVYGIRETNSHLIPAILDQLEDQSRSIELGNLTPARDFIHASDVASALVMLASEFKDDYRTYNVGTGTEHSVREVVDAVADALGEEITIKQDEERVRESDRPHLQADISRITSEFDWEPKYKLREGLKQVIEKNKIGNSYD